MRLIVVLSELMIALLPIACGLEASAFNDGQTIFEEIEGDNDYAVLGGTVSALQADGIQGSIPPIVGESRFRNAILNLNASEIITEAPVRAPLTRLDRLNLFFRCGALGEDCCHAPIQNVSAFGPLVSCNEGLGCDIATNKCVSTCGGPGQVCCDGPETRAPKWTADGKIYSPNSFNMREMCNEGVCDKQTHRCITCGTKDGDPCCPPDAAQATARCFGASLSCEFDPQGFYESGICRACGKKGRSPCDWGCDPGLGLRKGLCDICGGNLQPPCDNGCNSGLGLLQGLCRQCGNAGQTPCDNGCRGGLKIKNGLCTACGAGGQPPCDSGCDLGTREINGVCTPCGNNDQLPCTTGIACRYPMKVAGGVCRLCGADGQIPCNTGCNQWLAVKNGLCAAPQPETPESCAKIGQPCVAEHLSGTHCCQQEGARGLCVGGTCKACIAHGEPVPPWGTQLCCQFGDVPVMDQDSGEAVCGIPDVNAPK